MEEKHEENKLTIEELTERVSVLENKVNKLERMVKELEKRPATWT